MIISSKHETHNFPRHLSEVRDIFFASSAVEITKGTARTAEQEKKGRESRRIESRVCSVATPQKAAS
jgi:hypothetical protein